MANEFFQAFGPDAAITLTPKGGGRLEVYLDGEKIFDRKTEGNIYPDLKRVREMLEFIREKIANLEPAPADD